MRKLALLALAGYAAASVTAPAKAEDQTPPCRHIVFTGIACNGSMAMIQIDQMTPKEQQADMLARNPIRIGFRRGMMVSGPPGCGGYVDHPATVVRQIAMYGRVYYSIMTTLEFGTVDRAYSQELGLLISKADATCVSEEKE